MLQNKNKLEAYGAIDTKKGVNLEKLRSLIKERDELTVNKVKNTTNLKHKNKTIKELQESEVCPLCKRNLDDVDHTKEIDTLNSEIKELDLGIERGTTRIASLNEEINTIEVMKEAFDRNEKEMLKKRNEELE